MPDNDTNGDKSGKRYATLAELRVAVREQCIAELEALGAQFPCKTTILEGKEREEAMAALTRFDCPAEESATLIRSLLCGHSPASHDGACQVQGCPCGGFTGWRWTDGTEQDLRRATTPTRASAVAYRNLVKALVEARQALTAGDELGQWSESLALLRIFFDHNPQAHATALNALESSEHLEEIVASEGDASRSLVVKHRLAGVERSLADLRSLNAPKLPSVNRFIALYSLLAGNFPLVSEDQQERARSAADRPTVADVIAAERDAIKACRKRHSTN